MTPGARLAALLEKLPADAMLPAGWVQEQLADEQQEGAALAVTDTLAHDLTVKQFAACFGRSASAARLWCERGEVPGAFKLQGKTWRIPRASLEAFRRAQGAPVPIKPATGSLSDWRRKAG